MKSRLLHLFHLIPLNAYNLLCRRSALLAAGLIVTLVIVLWLPFGVRTTVGLFEEWYIINRLLNGENLFWDQVINPSRPMIFAPNALLFTLVPDSFIPFNLTYILLFITKGGIVYALLRRLVPHLPFVALLTALLAVIYPADEAVFSFRAINVQVSLVLGLIALYLLIVQWQSPRFWRWPLIWVLQALTLLIYEMMYVPFFAAPVLLWWLDKRFTRRMLRFALLWLSLPLILFVPVVLHLRQPTSGYLGSLITSAEERNLAAPGRLIEHSLRMYQRHLTEWGIAAHMIGKSPLFGLLALLIGLLTAAVGWRFVRGQPASLKTHLALIMGSLILMLLGFSAFLPGPTQSENWRVFFLTSIGAAIIVATLVDGLRLVPRIGHGLAVTIASAVVMLALIYSLHQHQHFARLSTRILDLFATIIEQAPAITDETVILLMDRTGIYADGWHLASNDSVLRGGLSTAYGTRVDAHFCPSVILPHETGRVCELRQEGVYLRLSNRELTIPYQRLIIFHNLPDGRIELLEHIPSEYFAQSGGGFGYNPHALINFDAPPPTSAIFPCWPLGDCVPPPIDSNPRDTFVEDFDSIVRGAGWHNPTVSRDSIWTRTDPATLYINPIMEHNLSIRFDLGFIPSPAVRDSMGLTVNGFTIPLTYSWDGNHVFSGTIPSETLRPLTELAFHINIPTDRTHILNFDWLEITPLE